MTLDGQTKRIELSPQFDVGIRSTAIGANVFLAFHNNAVYLSARAVGEYVMRIAIP